MLPTEARILVVDDEANILLTLQAILQEDGFHVDTVADGAEAIQAIRSRHYDLVLTDLKMPGVDGLGVLAEVQKCSPNTVTIMMTGYGSVDSALEAVQLGAYDYLLKPMEIAALKQAVRRSLERKRLSEVDRLYRVASRVSASFDRDAIAKEVEEAAQQVLRVRGAKIYPFSAGDSSGVDSSLTEILNDRIVQAILEQGMSLTDREAPLPLEKWASEQGMRSFAVVPGIGNGRLSCVLVAHNGGQEYEFHASALRYLQALAAQCALALSNATLFSRLQQNNLELEAANRKLRELDRLRTQFLSIASHELRTPLTIVMGYNSMLKESLADRANEDEKELIGESVTACQKLIRMVNSMLDLTQMDAGKMRTEFRATDLIALISAVATLFQAEAANRGIHLGMEVPSKLPKLLVDPDQIEQVVINLVGNALKFTDRGGQIHLALRYDTEAETVSIAVSDTGAGIAPEDQEVIFDEYAQLEKRAKKSSREGTGLGLAIVKRIVEAHSGAVGVESTVGKGSTFTIVLPARKLAGSASAVPA
ncbi:MAG TPA: ATP-binding protein [Terriglobales bacterium]|nr:ATP-binding protein [Terriglobales bacterium]